MHDDPRNPLTVGEALRALPSPRPPAGGWALLQARVQRQQRRRRATWSLAAALAAALALAAVLQLPTAAPPQLVGASRIDATPVAGSVGALQQESQRLESLLAWSGVAWVDTGDSAALDQQLAERLQWVDLQLAAAEPDVDADSEHLLWSERVLLLRQRAQLAQARVLLADRESASASEVLLAL